MKMYDWDFVLLRESPGPDGRVGAGAFVGFYRLENATPDNAAGYLRSLPLADAVWIGITRTESK